MPITSGQPNPIGVAAASGSIAAGAVAAGAVVSGAILAGALADGADVTQGITTDAKSTATDGTSVSIMQVLKEISYMEQNPASRAVTGTFYQGTQPVSLASAQIASGAYATGSIGDGADVTQGAKADAKNTATDSTAITIMQVLKQISYMEQNPASRAVTGTFYQVTQPISEAAPGTRAVTNAGSFAVQVDGTSAFSVDTSVALEASSVSKASAGRLYAITGRIDSTAGTDVYYLLLMDASTLPGDGAVTDLMLPLKINHTTGEDSFFDVDLTGNDVNAGIAAGTGIVWCISTTEFTKTIAGAVASASVLYV